MATESRPLDVRVDDRDGVVRVELDGELDLQTVPLVRAALRDRRTTGRTVRLDLSRLRFMDCAGLQVLLELQAAADRDGCTVEVEPDVSRAVGRLLDLTGRRPLLRWSR